MKLLTGLLSRMGRKPPFAFGTTPRAETTRGADGVVETTPQARRRDTSFRRKPMWVEADWWLLWWDEGHGPVEPHSIL